MKTNFVVISVFQLFIFFSISDIDINNYTTDNINNRLYFMEKENNSIIIKNEKRIFSLVSIKVYSSDSIIVNLKIVNKSNSVYNLYKDLLPNKKDILKLNLFNIVPVKGHFEDRIKKYYSDEVWLYKPFFDEDPISHKKYYQLSPIIVPRLEKDNFLQIKPNEIYAIEFNIAKSYDFKPFLKVGVNTFSIAYSVLMPRVIDQKHIMEIDKNDNLHKLIYDEIIPENKKSVALKRIEFIIK